VAFFEILFCVEKLFNTKTFYFPLHFTHRQRAKINTQKRAFSYRKSMPENPISSSADWIAQKKVARLSDPFMCFA